MAWYAAHVVMYVQFKDGDQHHYPVWENILLIESTSDHDALARATTLAKEDEGDHKGSLNWKGRPATMVFAGIRKLMAVSHQAIDDHIGSGDEVTYSEFDLPSREALDRLVAGDDVNLTYVE